MLLKDLKAGENGVKKMMGKEDRKGFVDEGELKAIARIMEELEKDPSVRDLMERNQKRYGTLTELDLKRAFTI